MQSIFNMYYTGSRYSFENSVTQILAMYPLLTKWLSWYEGNMKYILNSCFLPIEDADIYNDLDCTTNRNEGFHSELYR